MTARQVVDFDTWPYPRRIGHRGAGRLAPENTLAAFRFGASLGYRMFEFDVKLSADGVAMLMHDDSLERTTDGHGSFASRNREELARLDAGRWHSPAHAGERIPTLASVASLLREAGLLANIEIKPCPGRDTETGAAVASASAALWQSSDVPPLLSSFSESALEAARAAAPALPRALLVGVPGADWLARCRRLDCVAIDVGHDALTPAFVRLAHEARLRVVAYTVNDPARIAELDDWGVDSVITDALDRVSALPSGA